MKNPFDLPIFLKNESFSKNICESSTLNVFPDAERSGTENIAAADVVVLDELSLGDELPQPFAYPTWQVNYRG